MANGGESSAEFFPGGNVADVEVNVRWVRTIFFMGWGEIKNVNCCAVSREDARCCEANA